MAAAAWLITVKHLISKTISNSGQTISHLIFSGFVPTSSSWSRGFSCWLIDANCTRVLGLSSGPFCLPGDLNSVALFQFRVRLLRSHMSFFLIRYVHSGLNPKKAPLDCTSSPTRGQHWFPHIAHHITPHASLPPVPSFLFAPSVNPSLSLPVR